MPTETESVLLLQAVEFSNGSEEYLFRHPTLKNHRAGMDPMARSVTDLPGRLISLWLATY